MLFVGWLGQVRANDDSPLQSGDFEADEGEVVDFFRRDLSLALQLRQMIDNLVDRRVAQGEQFLVELEAGVVDELADQGFGAVGIQQQPVSRLELDRALRELNAVENAKQGASRLELLWLMTFAKQDRIGMARTGEAQLSCFDV